MGTDIHFFLEHRNRNKGNWTLDEWHKPYYEGGEYDDKNNPGKKVAKIWFDDKELDAEPEGYVPDNILELGEGHKMIEWKGKKYPVYDYDSNNEDLCINRPYLLFSLLSGVRMQADAIYEPRGFPDDASPELKMHWNSRDEHSPCWLYLHEFENVLEEWRRICIEQAKQDHEDASWVKDAYKEIINYAKKQQEQFKYKCPEGLFDMEAETRVVFWFDS